MASIVCCTTAGDSTHEDQTANGGHFLSNLLVLTRHPRVATEAQMSLSVAPAALRAKEALLIPRLTALVRNTTNKSQHPLPRCQHRSLHVNIVPYTAVSIHFIPCSLSLSLSVLMHICNYSYYSNYALCVCVCVCE